MEAQCRTQAGAERQDRSARGRFPVLASGDFLKRLGNAQANARQYNGPGAGERDVTAYLAGIDGMVYGEDPSEGFVRGRRFLHPKLGFTFTAPEGFTLDNTAQAVLGVKHGGAQALRLDVVRVPAEQTLAGYLTSGWIENIEPRTVEEITVNGFPAATAAAKGDQWDFRLYAVRFGSDVYRFIFAAKRRSADMDRTFRELIGSFRRMSLAEIEAGQAAAPPGSHGRAGRTARSGSPAAWPSPTGRSTASACSTGSPPPTKLKPGSPYCDVCSCCCHRLRR